MNNIAVPVTLALSFIAFGSISAGAASGDGSASASTAQVLSGKDHGDRDHDRTIAFQNVNGDWTNTTPCNTTSFDQNTGHLLCDGFTTWTGSFTGTSHYFFNGFVNLTTADITGTLSEAFTGSGLGASGTFHMIEGITISASTGAINIISRIDRGENGLADLAGFLTFTGTSNTAGIGTGTYAGAAGTLEPRDDNE